MPNKPKPERYLVEFFAEWIRNEDLRKRVLFREKEEMEKWGLSDEQSLTLRSLEHDDIRDLLVDELVNAQSGLGIDLKAILDAWVKYPSKGPGGSSGAAYEEGSTHVRGVEPAKITKDLESVVIILGHGWDDTLKIVFEPPAGTTPPKLVESKLIEADSEINVWQRAAVKVTLPKLGKWRVIAQVPSNAPDEDSTEDVFLEVV